MVHIISPVNVNSLSYPFRACYASQSTVDPDEVKKFQALASKWWDEQGEFAALHSMNDLRVPFIRSVRLSEAND